MMTHKLLRLPLLAVLALLLTACGISAGDIDSAPDPVRFERAEIRQCDPARDASCDARGKWIPEARCDDDGDGVFEACLSQRQLDRLFNATIDALCEANDRIAWLSDYYLGTQLEPSCAVAE